MNKQNVPSQDFFSLLKNDIKCPSCGGKHIEKSNHGFDYYCKPWCGQIAKQLIKQTEVIIKYF